MSSHLKVRAGDPLAEPKIRQHFSGGRMLLIHECLQRVRGLSNKYTKRPHANLEWYLQHTCRAFTAFFACTALPAASSPGAGWSGACVNECVG